MPAATSSEIEQRVPIVDNSSLNVGELNKEWALVSEAIRRGSLTNPSLQESLVGFADRPVDQDTASELLTAISYDDRVQKLAKKVGGSLLEFLSLPQVPESMMSTDITNARGLRFVDQDIADSRRWGRDEATIHSEIGRRAEAGVYTEGVTAAERSAVAQKYVYARDVKLLALGAELAQQGGVQLTEDHEATLTSGIHIKVSPELGDEATDLLDPNKWQYRRQLKDRVYEVGVDGKKYILKERKTNRHQHTMKHGHKEGQTVAEEFETGITLVDSASKREGRVQLHWEKPLAFVEYPDGFQFGIFEYEEGLDDQVMYVELSRAIRDRRTDFEEEYSAISKAAAEFTDHPLIRDPIEPPQKRSWRQALNRRTQVREPQLGHLSFEQFAEIKAIRMFSQAHDMYKEAILDAGFVNSDRDGYIYRLNPSGNVMLELVGFDYEYFEPISPEEIADRKERNEKFEIDNPRGFVYNIDSYTRLQQAAYLALLESEGRLPEAIKNLESL